MNGYNEKDKVEIDISHLPEEQLRLVHVGFCISEFEKGKEIRCVDNYSCLRTIDLEDMHLDAYTRKNVRKNNPFAPTTPPPLRTDEICIHAIPTELRKELSLDPKVSS